MGDISGKILLLAASVAPVVVIAFYIYFRDKYEKEPWQLLIKSILFGAIIYMPVLGVEHLVSKMAPESPEMLKFAYYAFIVASLIEEGFKLAAIYLLVWENQNFNEKFDGIVYAVFISIGFAAVENMVYVLQGGISVGIIRAITAVPFHALLGVIMGYYLAKVKFEDAYKKTNLWKAFMLPFAFHGVYDFCLMSYNAALLLLWIPFILFLYKDGFKKMFAHVEDSVFKPGAGE